jgi:hypothetical protein
VKKKNDPSTLIRYGKILHELKNVELRFYKPEEADLQIRGRIKKVNGVEKLLMYTKIRDEKYQALETDTANIGGALYSKIWNLVWNTASTMREDEIEKLKTAYLGKTK